MKKKLLWMLATILSCGLMLASCEIDNTDVKTDEYRTKIANTRWQLIEVQDQNSRWQSISLNPVLDIPEVWFSSGNGYEMRIRDYDGYKGVSTVIGTYKVADGNIVMTDSHYHGIAFELNIRLFNDDLLEGLFRIWSGLQPIDYQYIDGSYQPQDKSYVIRLKRIK